MFDVLVDAACIQARFSCTLHCAPSLSVQESVPSELMTFNMAVSVLWAAYNSVPPLLLLHFAFAGYKGMRTNVRICGIMSSLILLGVLICVWLLLPPKFDFGQVGLSLGLLQM